MKFLFILIVTSMLFLALTCQKEDKIVGSDKDVEINNLTFSVTNTYISGTTMYANGAVYNNGSNKVASPWFVEGQFYADSTLTLKLGGNNVQINVPLEQGKGTLWSLSFTPTQVSAQNYPKFRVSNLRGIYKNQ